MGNASYCFSNMMERCLPVQTLHNGRSSKSPPAGNHLGVSSHKLSRDASSLHILEPLFSSPLKQPCYCSDGQHSIGKQGPTSVCGTILADLARTLYTTLRVYAAAIDAKHLHINSLGRMYILLGDISLSPALCVG